MKPYTIEEFIKRRKSKSFIAERYFRLVDKKWCSRGCFARDYYPIRQEKIENLDCIIFISNLGYEYAVEISELQKLGILKKEEPMKIISLKEAYIVKCDTEEQTQNVAGYIKDYCWTWTFREYVINHLGILDENIKDSILYHYIPKSCEHLPILTFSEWKQLKDKEMNKDNKKIIGYKAPYDLMSGLVKKGDILFSNNSGYYHAYKNNKKIEGEVKHPVGIPKEIVETWEAHYEPEEIKIPMANGAFELIIKDGKVWHKNEDITKFVEEMVLWCNPNLSFGGYKALVDEITFSKTGCQNHKTSIKEWINVHNKLHGK